MYYILNETNQIIAADNSLLELCGVTHIDELSSGIITNEILFDMKSDEDLNIISLNGEENFKILKTSLSSLLGNLTLISISAKNETDASLTPLVDDEINITPEDSEDLDDKNNLNESIEADETLLADLEVNKSEPSLSSTDENENITFEDHLNIDDLMLDKEEPEDITHEEKDDNKEVDDSELFSLIADNDEKDEILSEENTFNIIDDEPFSLELKDDVMPFETEEVPKITIDINEISHIMGISPDDYSHFLNDFIDTALELEKDLQSTDTKIKADAIDTLSQLSDVLHLPDIKEIIENIENAEDTSTQRKVIESFYGSLSSISTTPSPDEELETIQEETVVEETIKEEGLELFEEPETLELFEEPETLVKPLIQEEVKTDKTTNTESFGSISLEDIKPKHFDFQLEEAANDLSLPVELIEEFVHDFIEQAHIETKKMLEAYEKGDLDTIQKIGHLLKGASSNLRINPLSDTLYKIQFCEGPENLDILIKDYWAHFLSFENQINMISK